MVHFIVRFEAIDVIADNREEAILKVKDICPNISRIDVAKISVERQEDRYNKAMPNMSQGKNKY